MITVKAGGLRLSPTQVGPLPRTQLGFFDARTGGTPVYTCTSDADGDCSILVPDTGSGQTNRDRRFWIRQLTTTTGYFTNDVLGVGSGTGSEQAYTFQTGTALRGGQTYTSGVDFMNDPGRSGNWTNTQSGGIWQNSLNDPAFPAQCGIDVALLLDLSNSVTDQQLSDLKTAAGGFVDALTGTPSKVGTFTFATNAPAVDGDTLAPVSVSTTDGAQTAKAKIDGYRRPASSLGGTNWDRGIFQIAQQNAEFDVAVVITDGNPTQYADAQGPGNQTRFHELETGIFSANAVKAKGTKLIAFGVGSAVGSAAGGDNLRAISGPAENDDFYRTDDYTALARQLRELALGNCRGSITVVKQVVPADAPVGSIDGALPQGGWTFTGTGTDTVSVDPPTAQVTADDTGAANFPLTFTGGVTSGPVTLTETPQAGYALQPVDGANAVCTRIDTGATIPVDNTTNGFTVDATSDGSISCSVYNRAPDPRATVELHKRWVVNGVTVPDGQQPLGLTARGELNGDDLAFDQVQGGFRQGEQVSIDETTDTTALPLCTLGSARLTEANGTTVDETLASVQTLRAGTNEYTITNTVTCTTRLRLDKTVRGGDADPTDWTLFATTRTGEPFPAGTTPVAHDVTPNAVYTLSEDTPHPEYVQFRSADADLAQGASGSWICQEVSADGRRILTGYRAGLDGQVAVPFGTFVACTAVNLTSTLTLRKVVTNTNGGTATSADWNLTATPLDPVPGLEPQTVTGSTTGASFHVRPGTEYRLTETTGPPGYTLTSLSCAVEPGNPRDRTITLAALDQATCTFTNTDQPAHLTLIKHVDNSDTGGTAEPADWTLTATGPTTLTGPGGSDQITNQTVPPGDYTLTETGGPDGYTPAGWDCGPATLTGTTPTDATVTVPVGGDVTCTITNTADQPRLTLIKTVTNNDGRAADPTDWTLTAAGPTTITGITGGTTITRAPIPVGRYTLTETNGPDGYTPGPWICTGAPHDTTTVTINLGDDVTCTINNDDNPPPPPPTTPPPTTPPPTQAPTSQAPTTQGPTTAPSNPSGLANTGGPSATTLILGLLLLAAGATLTAVTRNRRRRH